ncbi:MAG: rfbD [Gammaproteobacteria bacterium]|jgi:dTDP-4-dehydrorhamnose reductase|nr:rfbD [Gammaproteobacteria bacterium]
MRPYSNKLKITITIKREPILDMKILLLGANGQLGTDLMLAYQDAQFQGPELIPFSRADIDISQLDNLYKKLFAQDFDLLLNCTGYTQVDKAETEPESAFLLNAYAVAKMAEVCQLKQAKFIHISTDHVFGGSLANHPISTDSDPAPINMYGQSKLLGEQLAMGNCCNTVILRTASLYGLNPSKTKGNFVESIIRLAKEKGSLRVIADQIMSPTSTSELAKMIVKAIQAEIPSGIYHAVNSGQASWYEFACAIIDKAKISCEISPIPASEYPLPAKRPSYSVLDNTTLCKLIGPVADWHEALEYYIKARGC